MRLIMCFSICVLFASAGQEPLPPPDMPPARPPTEDRLPNGKSQKDAIAKEAYRKSVEEARELVKMSQALQSELEKNDQYVISVSEIRKTEEIERLAKRIRGRLKGF